MQTDEVEAKEAQLMSDFASQLSVTRSDLSVIMEQADKHRDENVTLHNNCEFLRSKLSSIEASLKIVNPYNMHNNNNIYHFFLNLNHVYRKPMKMKNLWQC